MSGLVYVIDDDASFRSAIERRLKLAGYDVEAYSSAEPMLDRRPCAATSACIVLDAQMPGLGGLELQSRLIELGSILPIVFVTGHADVPTTVQAIKAGAEDVLTKPASSEQLIAAIERAMVRHKAARLEQHKHNSLLALVATLTPRERQVFDLIVRGKINRAIAHELGTTERTVKAHRHQVMEKMQAQSLAELVLSAERVGMLDPSGGSSST